MPPLATKPLPDHQRSKKGITFGGVLLIFLIALLQALGFCRPLEQMLINGLHKLTQNLLPEPPRVVLISLESTPRGFDSMDVAMAMRGLGELHPLRVIVDSAIASEEGPVPFLPGILSRMKEVGIATIVPQPPSPLAPLTPYQAIPLTRYSLGTTQTNWRKIIGKGIPGTGDAFLPDDRGAGTSLPLLGTTSNNTTIGSLWWWAFPSAVRQNPFLLFGRLLLLGNNTPFHLTPLGAIDPGSSEALKEIPLDDFLLHIEQREQGTLSPAFDALWIKATVLLATHDDLQKAAALAALLEETSYLHLFLGTQLIMAIGWIAVFLLLVKYRSRFPIHRWLISLIIVITLLAITLLLMHLGIIIPFLPGLMTALLVMIP